MLNIRTHWPWISTLLAAIVTLNPLGLDVIDLAFFSGEALSRNIWGPIALAAMAIMALMIVLEWRIRTLILTSRARDTTIA
jgi:hypothetical protein